MYAWGKYFTIENAYDTEEDIKQRKKLDAMTAF